MTGSPIPDSATAAVRRFCDANSPSEHAHDLRVEYGVRGKAITIFECRPPWDQGRASEWSRQPIAQLRFDPGDHRWTLFYADRNDRWHPYEMAEPTTKVDELLAEIDHDPTCIFWG
ncbi:MAG TPA: transposase [Acidimicrobiaceae bacterium]|nr:transposase [Acidimicrobiaceae bacterium]